MTDNIQNKLQDKRNQLRPIRILLVEDLQLDVDLLLAQLKRGGLRTQTVCVDEREKLVSTLSNFRPDLVLSDYKLPGLTGVEVIQHVKEKYPFVPVIVVTGAIGEEAAVDVMRKGATDYILKDKLFRLVPAINRALQEATEAAQRKKTEKLLRLQRARLTSQNQQLFDSEQRFRQMAENISEVFWMTDVEKREMIYISPGYERIWGRRCESLYRAPKEWLTAIHPADRKEVELAAITKQPLGTYDEIYRIIGLNGSIRWIHDRAFPVRNETGEIYRIAGIAEDVTEQILAEQRLEVRSAVIRLLAEAGALDEAVSGILQTVCESLEWEFGSLWRREDDGMRCAEAWCSAESQLGDFKKATRDAGMPAQEDIPTRAGIGGKALWFRNLLEHEGLMSARVSLAVKYGLHSAFAFPVTLNTKVIGVMEFFSRAIRERDEELLEMMSALGSQIGQFIGRKEAERRVTTLAHAVESTAEMICITDLDDRFTFVNNAFELGYGYSAEEIIGKTPDILFSPTNPPELKAEILTATRSGGWRGEVLDRTKDGTEFPVFLSTSVIKDFAGQPVGLMGVAQNISERLKSERQIRLLAHAVQSTAELVSVTDSKNRFTFVNKAFLDAYGYTEDEVYGRTPEFLYSPSNEPDLCKRILERTLAGGWSGEVLNRAKTGREFPINLTTSPIKNEAGIVLGLVGLAQDISERKRAEKQAAAFSALGHRLSCATTAEEAAEIIMDAASELFGWDAGYVHLYARGQDCIVPVLTVDTVDGQRMPIAAETFTQDPSPLMRSIMKDGAKLIDCEADPGLPLIAFGDRDRPSACKMYVPVRSAHEVLGVLSIQSYAPKAYSSGDLMLLQTLADDCGGALARISISEALTKAENKYRSIFENATEGIFQTTVDGRYISANPGLARMFGYGSTAELIATVQNIEKQTFVSAENAADLKSRLAGSDRILGFEAERYRKDRSRFWTSINVRAIRDSSGAVSYYEGTVQDITERKNLERELLDSTNNERRRVGHELHDGLGQFLAGIAFKAKALEQSLAATNSTDAAHAAELAALVSNAINQTRSIARGLDPVEIETIGLPAALQNLLRDIQNFFNVHCALRCPDLPGKFSFEAGLALYRIVQESIHNAITHGDAKSIAVDVTVEADQFTIVIRDDGSGFNPGAIKDAGMGLRVMQHRARSLGGTIKIDSQPGRGAEIRCRVPLSQSIAPR